MFTHTFLKEIFKNQAYLPTNVQQKKEKRFYKMKEN